MHVLDINMHMSGDAQQVNKRVSEPQELEVAVNRTTWDVESGRWSSTRLVRDVNW